jgi:two-component system, OmpR family, phosphate regulon sensor histidine kinase PhoR
MRVYAWTVMLAVVAIFSIAIGAAVTVSRQLALQELKTTSVATVAHELRTPLASMRMLVDTLREGRVRNESQLREYLDLIGMETLRLSRLTDNFLTLSRLEHRQQPFELTMIAPRAVAEQAVQSLRARLEAEDVHFTFEAAESLPPIRVDRDAMATVLTNLLDNALKYSGEDKHVALRLRKERGGVSFNVTDDGIGLSRADRQAIFEPFYQVDRKLSRIREGCGLGLSIVKHIVIAHRGEITVKSEPKKGSTFTVIIPAATTNGRSESARSDLHRE